MTGRALIITDMQYDFCAGGSLAVQGADDLVPGINAAMKSYSLVIATKDWHPPGHISYASSHINGEPFSVIDTSSGMQELWPDHCTAGTRGAQLHDDLDLRKVSLILHKGMNTDLDSYSVFRENDKITPTGLHGYLQEHAVTQVDLCGVAADVCVYFSALDALEFGYTVTLLTELTRGVDVPPGTLEKRLGVLKNKGVELA